jgi:predicted DNA-binding mobile mystery protein A
MAGEPLRVQRLKRQQVDEMLLPFRGDQLQQLPRGGWVREVRQSLQMPLRWVAARMGVTVSAVSHVESREAEGSITLRSLREAAEAMDCDLVYAIVPRAGSVAAMLEDRARRVARERVEHVAHTMALEDQATSEASVQEEIEEVVRSLLERPADLWT